MLILLALLHFYILEKQMKIRKAIEKGIIIFIRFFLAPSGTTDIFLITWSIRWV